MLSFWYGISPHLHEKCRSIYQINSLSHSTSRQLTNKLEYYAVYGIYCVYRITIMCLKYIIQFWGKIRSLLIDENCHWANLPGCELLLVVLCHQSHFRYYISGVLSSTIRQDTWNIVSKMTLMIVGRLSWDTLSLLSFKTRS